MAVVTTESTNAKYRVFSSTDAGLATAVREVTNELEQHTVPMKDVQFNTVHDGTDFTYVATTKRG